MRLRRRIIGLVRKIIYGLLLLIGGGGLIAFGLFLPQIFGSFGIDAFYLRILGFAIITGTVVLLIALFEVVEHL